MTANEPGLGDSSTTFAATIPSFSASPAHTTLSSLSNKKVLVLFIHGFLGSEESFDQFPSDLLATLRNNPSASASRGTSIGYGIRDIEARLYPRFDTKGDSQKALSTLTTWLELNACSPEYEGVVLIGHSMGGILAVDAFRRLSGFEERRKCVKDWEKACKDQENKKRKRKEERAKKKASQKDSPKDSEKDVKTQKSITSTAKTTNGDEKEVEPEKMVQSESKPSVASAESARSASGLLGSLSYFFSSRSSSGSPSASNGNLVVVNPDQAKGEKGDEASAEGSTGTEVSANREGDRAGTPDKTLRSGSPVTGAENDVVEAKGDATSDTMPHAGSPDTRKEDDVIEADVLEMKGDATTDSVIQSGLPDKGTEDDLMEANVLGARGDGSREPFDGSSELITTDIGETALSKESSTDECLEQNATKEVTPLPSMSPDDEHTQPEPRPSEEKDESVDGDTLLKSLQNADEPDQIESDESDSDDDLPVLSFPKSDTPAPKVNVIAIIAFDSPFYGIHHRVFTTAAGGQAISIVSSYIPPLSSIPSLPLPPLPPLSPLQQLTATASSATVQLTSTAAQLTSSAVSATAQLTSSAVSALPQVLGTAASVASAASSAPLSSTVAAGTQVARSAASGAVALGSTAVSIGSTAVSALPQVLGTAASVASAAPISSTVAAGTHVARTAASGAVALGSTAVSIGSRALSALPPLGAFSWRRGSASPSADGTSKASGDTQPSVEAGSDVKSEANVDAEGKKGDKPADSSSEREEVERKRAEDGHQEGEGAESKEDNFSEQLTDGVIEGQRGVQRSTKDGEEEENNGDKGRMSDETADRRDAGGESRSSEDVEASVLISQSGAQSQTKGNENEGPSEKVPTDLANYSASLVQEKANKPEESTINQDESRMPLSQDDHPEAPAQYDQSSACNTQPIPTTTFAIPEIPALQDEVDFALHEGEAVLGIEVISPSPNTGQTSAAVEISEELITTESEKAGNDTAGSGTASGTTATDLPNSKAIVISRPTNTEGDVTAPESTATATVSVLDPAHPWYPWVTIGLAGAAVAGAAYYTGAAGALIASPMVQRVAVALAMRTAEEARQHLRFLYPLLGTVDELHGRVLDVCGESWRVRNHILKGIEYTIPVTENAPSTDAAGDKNAGATEKESTDASTDAATSVEGEQVKQQEPAKRKTKKEPGKETQPGSTDILGLEDIKQHGVSLGTTDLRCFKCFYIELAEPEPVASTSTSSKKDTSESQASASKESNQQADPASGPVADVKLKDDSVTPATTKDSEGRASDATDPTKSDEECQPLLRSDALAEGMSATQENPSTQDIERNKNHLDEADGKAQGDLWHSQGEQEQGRQPDGNPSSTSTASSLPEPSSSPYTTESDTVPPLPPRPAPRTFITLPPRDTQHAFIPLGTDATDEINAHMYVFSRAHNAGHYWSAVHQCAELVADAITDFRSEKRL
ncbi:hypothetical protein HK102_000099 [Quaeritorhiza haematococci]|nr:hypothetical protein HK102_000099 [Quaeritorhiza haematococci]